MIKSDLLRTIFLLLLSPLTLIAQGIQNHQVTASDYCDFLNDVGSSDVIPAQTGTQNNINPNFLYNEKMGSASNGGCIIRVGMQASGSASVSYQYFVIAGQENWPMTFVNEKSEKAYCYWSQNNPILNLQTEDLFLSSNKITFQIMLSSSSLAMFPEMFATAANMQSERVAGVEAIVFFASLFGEVRMNKNPGIIKSSESLRGNHFVELRENDCVETTTHEEANELSPFIPTIKETITRSTTQIIREHHRKYKRRSDYLLKIFSTCSDVIASRFSFFQKEHEVDENNDGYKKEHQPLLPPTSPERNVNYGST